MVVSLTLPTRGFSVNKMFYRSRATKTAEARAWEAETAALLEEHHCLTEFAAAWNAMPSNAGIEVRFRFNYPAYIFYTKDGKLSNKVFDVDNCVKFLLDVLFGTRLKINDKNVTKIVSEKAAGSDYSIDISIRIR